MSEKNKAVLEEANAFITLTDKDGKAVHHSYCDVWRFRGGKIAELKAFVIETEVG